MASESAADISWVLSFSCFHGSIVCGIVNIGNSVFHFNRDFWILSELSWCFANQMMEHF